MGGGGAGWPSSRSGPGAAGTPCLHHRVPDDRCPGELAEVEAALAAKIHLSRLAGLNMPKYRAITHRFDLFGWENVAHL